jgi:hypothetical protein
MFFSLYWVFLLSILGAQAPENLGTKIVTRKTLGPAGFSEQRLYIMADRRRLELRHSVQRRNNDGSTEMKDELSSILIVRCDLEQSYLLHPRTEEYSSSPYPLPRWTPKAAQPTGDQSKTAETAKPTLRVETTTVDTGERQEMFGYTARHIITTRKQTPLEGSNSEPSESVTDGWYIDIDRRTSCDPKPLPGIGHGGFVSSRAGLGGKQLPIEKPKFVDIGAREIGLPVKETRTLPMTTGFSDGTRAMSAYTEELEVTVLEKAALDPTLFEAPSGYKQVERSQKRLAE